MLIGIDCFKDTEIKSMIMSCGRKGTCDLTDVTDTYVYDTDNTPEDFELTSYFSEILEVYTPQSELPGDFPEDSLAYIEGILESDWSIFSLSQEKIKIALQEICKSEYSVDSKIYMEKVGIDKFCDSDYLRRHCLMRESSWEKFTTSIKSINRFHSNHVNLELLKTLFESPGLCRELPKGSKSLYRARISDENGYHKDEMGPPPLNKISAGRANAQGIRCLYLAGDIKTTIHEVRARDLDFVTIGEFETTRDLKIVDLANLEKISPFTMGSFDKEWFAINMAILKKISKEIAKPLRRQDSELDYLPAQYIADYIKSLGYDGICYRSTLKADGINYAVFDCKKVRCIGVRLVHVDMLEYDITEC